MSFIADDVTPNPAQLHEVAALVRRLRAEHEFLDTLGLSVSDFYEFAASRALDNYKEKPELFQGALKEYLLMRRRKSWREERQYETEQK